MDASGEKVLDRAGFLRYLVSSGASTVMDLAGHFINPLANVEETKKLLVKPLIPLSQYDSRPQLLTAANPPLFLVGEPGKDLRALKATCEKDGFLLTYLPQQEALYCAACNAKHGLKRGEETAGDTLPTFTVAVDGDYICLIR